jgi:hypothetical protein
MAFSKATPQQYTCGAAVLCFSSAWKAVVTLGIPRTGLSRHDTHISVCPRRVKNGEKFAFSQQCECLIRDCFQEVLLFFGPFEMQLQVQISAWLLIIPLYGNCVGHVHSLGHRRLTRCLHF